MLKRLINNYGMVIVLLLLCLLFSILTLEKQTPQNKAAAIRLAERIKGDFNKSASILAVGAANSQSALFAKIITQELKTSGYSHTRVVVGSPIELKQTLDGLHSLDLLVPGNETVKWTLIHSLPENYPAFKGVRVLRPAPSLWPVFLKRANLLSVVDRIVVIAIIAIGMTMVIITGGIDLSVGSLIALSAITATSIMKSLGGVSAPPGVVLIGYMGGIVVCGIVGAVVGFIVAWFKVAPFITTLSVMLMARGAAFQITGGFSIYQTPPALPWLGQGRLFGLPNTVILLVILYAIAHVFMTRIRMGRYIYAVGGNKEASRLSGVPVKKVIVFVYAISALTAGLGGCIQTSQLNSGAPNIGEMYELYVIAAVVVGGTSLSGGAGRILGTLIGAFIISVIQNGMNLLRFGSYTQMIVLGAVILGAVLLDRARASGRLKIKI